MRSILLVEDDANFGLVLCDYLKMNGYDVDLAKNGSLGYNMFHQRQYDLCILDVMMPEMDGFSLAEKLTKVNREVPFVFLTAKSLKKDVLEGYRLGAIDYLNKPFDPEILMMKIKAILGRAGSKSSQKSKHYNFVGYHLDYGLRRLSGNGKQLSLSPKETALLAYLLDRQNKLVKRDEVLTAIWKESTYFTARSMDVYVNKLRKHFKTDNRIALENLRGEGFIFSVDSAPQHKG